jgi:hypothetical protein
VDGATVFIPEGEAKVDALLEWSVPATHIATGTKDYADLFFEADVILMPDNDASGWKHVNTVGAALHGVARRIRVLIHRPETQEAIRPRRAFPPPRRR